MAAIGSVLPIAPLQAMVQEKSGALEKTNLKIGFIPITCATPLIMAHPLGFYSKQGLNVEVVKTAGWALIRDKMLNKEYDATHFLSPMPLAISLGVGSNPTPMNVATIQNTNGQAITLHVKHKDKRDPKDWKGFKFAVPFDPHRHAHQHGHCVARYRRGRDAGRRDRHRIFRVERVEQPVVVERDFRDPRDRRRRHAARRDVRAAAEGGDVSATRAAARRRSSTRWPGSTPRAPAP